VQHNYKDPKFGDSGGAVTIGDNAWISCRCTILPGVHIGEGAVIAAGATVTNDVPPYAVMAGTPAKKIADRPREIDYHLGDGHAIPFI
jgi:acetyltransferase-like isoleucine patch superfamily enzyme